MKSLVLLGSGWTYKKVSEALLLDEETLRSYVKRYRSGGLKVLLKDNSGGRVAKLSTAEIQELCDHLENNLYVTAEEIIA